MENSDTLCLLKECNSGSKMAVSSLDEVSDKVCNSDMKALLEKSREHHVKLGNEIHALLTRHQSMEQEPPLMAKGMSWLKTNVKMSLDESDSSIADLLTDGCSMGIKSLHRYLNQYGAADEDSKKICKKLISIEEELYRDLCEYL